MTTKITEQNISNISNAAVQWQTVVTADGSTATTAVAGYGYFIDTTSAAHTVNLPNTANVGDTIILKDYTGTWGTNNVTISSTLKISGADTDGTLSTNNTTVTVVYMDTTKGWTPIQNSTQDALASDQTFISATGGTVTESGDYKIHTFTGDGCFVVSSVGNPAGSTSVDYLVVAGGGGAGRDRGGGGGAGGYRESSGTASGCYSASPLGACVAALPVSATTYPVTVGGGGSGGPGIPPAGCGGRGTAGSNSVFSTITSSGGGESGPGDGPCAARNGASGGSGGGGGAGNSAGGTAGSGNTPPVSPPQGNNGGISGGSLTESERLGSGGGGATATGSNGVPGGNGNGGAGATTSISGSSTTYAGGGGGGRPTGTAGSGGTGGGGDGSNSSATGSAGTTNTGGGAGGGGNNCSAGGAGGKGIVIIRYKFQ